MLLLLPPLVLQLLLATPSSALHPPSPILEFSSPHISSNTSSPFPLDIRASEDGSCPANYISCSSLSPSYGAACCSSNSICALDQAKNIACCPIGSKCTGIISSPSSPTAAPESTVSNPYFPYPYIPTSFANAAICTSYSSACDANYAACTADLQGGFGVTIAVPGGGGTTIAPLQTGSGTGGGGVPEGEAPSVCSSLSSVACKGANGGCASWGTSSATGATAAAAAATGNGSGNEQFLIASTASANAAARAGWARATGGVAGVGIGMGVGVGLGVVRGML